MRQRYLRHIVIALLPVVFFITSSGAQHTLSIEPEDTVFLEVNDWRGQLQWQMSLDNTNWANIPGRIYDTLKYVPKDFPSYFRMKIIDGECEPHYTEVIEVQDIPVPPSIPVVTTLEPFGMAPFSAISGGTVTKTGGLPVTARGVVYSTSPNPDLDNGIVISSGSGKGSFKSLLSGLTPNTKYYVRAFAKNSLGTAYGQEFSFMTPPYKVYAIGEEGPAGGLVFYDKGFWSDGWRYLEVAPAHWAGGRFDPFVDLRWGCDQILIGGTSTAIGAGKTNTDLILAKGCAEPYSPVQLAANAVINGYDDWFLPSRDEVKAIFTKLFYLTPDFYSSYGFGAMTYTTSSEIDETSVWGVSFATGSYMQDTKRLATITLRPVRRF